MLRVDPRPLYIQAVEKIEELIRREGLAPNDRLPSEVKLAELLGISRPTVRETLRELELRGRIRRSQGRGTILTEPPIRTHLTTLESLESLAAREGWSCGTEQIEIREVPLPDDLEAVLNATAGEPTTYLSRIKTRDGDPVCRMQTWLLARVLSVEELSTRFKDSIIEFLLAEAHPHLDYAIAEVGAAAADPATAAMLRIEPGAPLVVLTELFQQHPSLPLCYSVNCFIPRSVRLEVLRRPRPIGR